MSVQSFHNNDIECLKAFLPHNYANSPNSPEASEHAIFVQFGYQFTLKS
jgi:hypothetical protein